jgi:uroporphyrin-III C-methyltransferase
MPMSQLDEVAAALQKGGLAANTPAAIVQSATTEDERVVESTLSKLVADARAQGIGSPAIVVIGAIAGLRRQLLAGLVGWR